MVAAACLLGLIGPARVRLGFVFFLFLFLFFLFLFLISKYLFQ
jgi:hypothetical protein